MAWEGKATSTSQLASLLQSVGVSWTGDVMPFGMINIRFCYATAGSARVCRCVFVCVSTTLQVRMKKRGAMTPRQF